MTTTLESQRSALEELEQIEQAIADRFRRNPKLFTGSTANGLGNLGSSNRKRNLKEFLIQQHEIKKFLDQYEKQCLFLKRSLYDDSKVENGNGHINGNLNKKKKLTDEASSSLTDFESREKEIEEINDPEMNFNQLHSQIDKIKDYHRRYPNQKVEDLGNLYKMNIPGSKPKLIEDLEHTRLSVLSDFAADLNIDSLFSDEERYGQYLDLVKNHGQYLNMKSVLVKNTYEEYLLTFNKIDDLPLAVKNDTEYFDYISQLANYLENFLLKTQPLSNPKHTILKIEQDFEKEWENNSKKFEVDGKETVKGIFCKACDKYFSKETVYKGHLNGKKHKRAAKALNDIVGNTETNDSSSKQKKIGLYEYKVKELAELFGTKVADTSDEVQRRKRLLPSDRLDDILAFEREQEEYEQELLNTDKNHNDDKDSDEESDTADAGNPLNLPLGFDGNPIPFWLWKLQGLGIKHKCEICGNITYKGQKTFEKHFVDVQHCNGLKFLGIEPSISFKGITSINEALELWKKIEKQKKTEDGIKENVIEMEDEEGNVMSEKVYHDLKKQGLL